MPGGDDQYFSMLRTSVQKLHAEMNGSASFRGYLTRACALHCGSSDYDVGSGAPSRLHDVSNEADALILGLLQADVAIIWIDKGSCDLHRFSN